MSVAKIVFYLDDLILILVTRYQNIVRVIEQRKIGRKDRNSTKAV